MAKKNNSSGNIGIGMAKPRRAHQQLECQLWTILNANCEDISIDDDNEMLWQAELESALGPSGHGQAPDVMLGTIDREDNMHPYIIIEIEHTQGIAKAKTTAQEYVDIYAKNNKYFEAYVVNYVTHKWYAFGPNADKENPSYSTLLDMDLDDEVDWDKVDELSRRAGLKK